MFGALGSREVWGCAQQRDPWAGTRAQIRQGVLALAGVSGMCRQASATPPRCHPLLLLSGMWDVGKGGSVMGGRGPDFALLVCPLPQAHSCLSKDTD